MGRGLARTRDTARLVAAGALRRPRWMSFTEPNPPSGAMPRPAARVPPKLTTLEDVLRARLLRRRPELFARAAVDLLARSRAERDVAEQFVAVQARAMRERGLDERAAYAAAERETAAAGEASGDGGATVRAIPAYAVRGRAGASRDGEGDGDVLDLTSLYAPLTERSPRLSARDDEGGGDDDDHDGSRRRRPSSDHVGAEELFVASYEDARRDRLLRRMADAPDRSKR